MRQIFIDNSVEKHFIEDTTEKRQYFIEDHIKKRQLLLDCIGEGRLILDDNIGNRRCEANRGCRVVVDGDEKIELDLPFDLG